MATLTALPVPVAANPDFVAHNTETIIVSSEPFSKQWKVCLHDGTPLLIVSGESLSMSHRKTISDPQGRKLCQIRRQTWTMGTRYYAEATEDGPRLWELESHTGLTSRNNKMTFSNQAAGGEKAALEVKETTFGSVSQVKYDGKEVAIIEKKRWKMRHEYHLTIAKGLDMSLIVGLVIALDDKTRTSRAATAGAAGGGGGC
jgi:uncharacterized protein YxjI